MGAGGRAEENEQEQENEKEQGNEKEGKEDGVRGAQRCRGWCRWAWRMCPCYPD